MSNQYSLPQSAFDHDQIAEYTAITHDQLQPGLRSFPLLGSSLSGHFHCSAQVSVICSTN